MGRTSNDPRVSRLAGTLWLRLRGGRGSAVVGRARRRRRVAGFSNGPYAGTDVSASPSTPRPRRTVHAGHGWGASSVDVALHPDGGKAGSGDGTVTRTLSDRVVGAIAGTVMLLGTPVALTATPSAGVELRRLEWGLRGSGGLHRHTGRVPQEAH